MSGSGKILINNRAFENYFPLESLRSAAAQPLTVPGMVEKFDVLVNVRGGGPNGQAGAVRHGIARALLKVDPELRAVLRDGGFLTRDVRTKERKKPGLRRARKAVQYTKR